LDLANNPLSCPLIERGDRAESWAVLSTEGRYRYAIGRRLAHQPNGLGGPVVWIGLNPSTADHTRDDPTMRRILRFSAAVGAAEVVVLNVFAYRATDPAQLGRVADPVGPANPLTWDHHLSDPAMVIAAWGAGFCRSHTHTITAAATRAQALSARCLGVTAGGHPRHPLYVPATTPLEAY
jgi:hypothetical protein